MICSVEQQLKTCSHEAEKDLIMPVEEDIMTDKLSRKEIKAMLRNAVNLQPEEIIKLVTMLQKMPVELPKRELEAMLKKPGKERYIYSLKRIAEQKTAWTLKNSEGIITTTDDNGDNFIYIWPYKEYAVKCMTDEWGKLELLRLSFDRLLTKILPDLSKRGTKVAVFEVPGDPFLISVSADDFLNNLLYERSKYE